MANSRKRLSCWPRRQYAPHFPLAKDRDLRFAQKGVLAGVPFFDEVFKQLDCS